MIRNAGSKILKLYSKPRKGLQNEAPNFKLDGFLHVRCLCKGLPRPCAPEKAWLPQRRMISSNKREIRPPEKGVQNQNGRCESPHKRKRLFLPGGSIEGLCKRKSVPSGMASATYVRKHNPVRMANNDSGQLLPRRVTGHCKI